MNSQHQWPASCAAVGIPKANPDSFAMHAPLELMARHRLMSIMKKADQIDAEQAMQNFIEAYKRSGSPLGFQDCYEDVTAPSETVALTRLETALDNGNVGLSLSLSVGLSKSVTTSMLCHAIGRHILPSLACAGHGAIFLYQLQQLCATDARHAMRLLTGLVAGLAGAPRDRVTIELAKPQEGGAGDGVNTLLNYLRNIAPLSKARTSGIAQLVRQAIEAGHLTSICQIVSDIDPDDTPGLQAAYEGLSEVAVLSMLIEPARHAPYGWTHCLTLPQSIWGIRQYQPDRRSALVMAALYVAAFRATIAQAPLHLRASPVPATAPKQIESSFSELAGQACKSPDAHLVKYVLACLDEARHIPRHASLYLAAARRLTAIWVRQPT